MAKQRPLITDEQWEKLAPLLPVHKQSRKGGRRPRKSPRPGVIRLVQQADRVYFFLLV